MKNEDFYHEVHRGHEVLVKYKRFKSVSNMHSFINSYIELVVNIFSVNFLFFVVEKKV